MFQSPQLVVNHSEECSFLTSCATYGTLRAVMMDEFHLQIQHGQSFQTECSILKEIFFVPIFHPKKTTSDIPKFVATTATYPESIFEGATQLTSLLFPPSSIYRGSVDYEFTNLDITMRQVICHSGDYVKNGVTEAVDHVKKGGGKLVLFCNSRPKSFEYATAL